MHHAGFPPVRRRWRHALMAAAVCSLAGLGTTPATAQAMTPDELAADVIGAARDGSLDRFLACLEPGSRQGLMAAMAEGRTLDEAMAAFTAALDGRFDGGGPLLGTGREDPATALRRLAGVEILETRTTPTGAEIRLRLPAVDGEDGTSRQEETLVAVPGRQGWGLVLGFPPAAGREDRRAALARVTEAVGAGAFASRLDAMIAADKAVRGERP